jgi:hypothetical protein
LLVFIIGDAFETWAGEHNINKDATPLVVISEHYDEFQLIMNHFAIKHFLGHTTAVKTAMEVKMKKRKDAFRSALG